MADRRRTRAAKPAEESGEVALVSGIIETVNEYAIHSGQNLPNHSMSIAGLGKFVRQGMEGAPIFRTKQAAYRYAAWLITVAEISLPDEEGCEEHDFAAILAAIQNT